MQLRVEHITKVFPRNGHPLPVIADVSFEIREATITALIGPSGCGKTTLMKILAGLAPPTSGRVHSEVEEPKIIMVWQDHRLYPWRTVERNIAFGLELARCPRGERIAAVADAVKLIKLQGFEQSYPHELSVGMQQRVSLARSLAVHPDVLLLDEPFSSLDFQLKRIFLKELKRIQRETGTPMVYVTHDTREAVKLADEILVFSRRPARVIASIQDVPSHDPYRLEREIQAALTGEIESS